MHRIFSGNGWLAILSIRKPAPDHRPSRLPVQKPLVLFILCILCIHVHKKYRFPGAVAVRSQWQRWPGLCRAWCGRDARAPGGTTLPGNPSRTLKNFAKGSRFCASCGHSGTEWTYPSNSLSSLPTHKTGACGILQKALKNRCLPGPIRPGRGNPAGAG